VGALTDPAGVGVMDEPAVKIWIQFPVECVVEEPVTHRGFVDVAGFWVADSEMPVTTVLVRLVLQILMQTSDLIYQVRLKFENI
jgi:hypothetical protein